MRPQPVRHATTLVLQRQLAGREQRQRQPGYRPPGDLLRREVALQRDQEHERERRVEAEHEQQQTPAAPVARDHLCVIEQRTESRPHRPHSLTDGTGPLSFERPLTSYTVKRPAGSLYATLALPDVTRPCSSPASLWR